MTIINDDHSWRSYVYITLVLCDDRTILANHFQIESPEVTPDDPIWPVFSGIRWSRCDFGSEKNSSKIYSLLVFRRYDKYHSAWLHSSINIWQRWSERYLFDLNWPQLTLHKMTFPTLPIHDFRRLMADEMTSNMPRDPKMTPDPKMTLHPQMSCGPKLTLDAKITTWPRMILDF